MSLPEALGCSQRQSPSIMYWRKGAMRRRLGPQFECCWTNAESNCHLRPNRPPRWRATAIARDLLTDRLYNLTSPLTPPSHGRHEVNIFLQLPCHVKKHTLVQPGRFAYKVGERATPAAIRTGGHQGAAAVLAALDDARIAAHGRACSPVLPRARRRT